MHATLSNYHQAPRKVRLIAGLVRGKRVDRALAELAHLPKRAAGPLAKLIASAAASAKETKGLGKDKLIVKSCTVDQGLVMKRFMPRARGSASQILHRSSVVRVALAPLEKN